MLTALVIIQSLTLLVTMSQYSLTSKLAQYIVGRTGGHLK